MKITREKVSDLKPDPEQPRKQIDEAELLALGQDMKAHGQHVPVIACRNGDGLIILDGHRRCLAATRVGIPEILAVVLNERPPAAELHLLQLGVDVHRVGLSAFERADLLQRIMTENGFTVSQLAAETNLKQPLVSKLLPLANLPAELREMLKGVDQEKCYIVACEPHPAKQLELAKQAGGLTRDQVRRASRGVELKTKSASFALPGGFTVIVRGKTFGLKEGLAALQSVIKEMKQAERESWDISTLIKVLGDRAKVQP